MTSYSLRWGISSPVSAVGLWTRPEADDQKSGTAYWRRRRYGALCMQGTPDGCMTLQHLPLLLVVTALLLLTLVSAVHAANPLPSQPATLDEAVTAVRTMVQQGRSRDEIASWVTQSVDSRVTNINSIERMSLPVNWIPFVGASMGVNKKFAEWRDRNIFDYRTTAQWTWENGVGQCSEIASTVYYILKGAGVSGNVRILNSGGHEFVVWGMQDGANPDKPSTWDTGARALDPWQGSVLTPQEAQSNGWMGDDGKATMSDQTTGFDKEAKGWTVSGTNAGTSGSGEGCFIATAAYGTPLAPDIQVLRDFRDQVLLRNPAGRTLVQSYYQISPGIADVIARHEVLRTIVREGFVRPLVHIIRLLEMFWRTSPESASTGHGTIPSGNPWTGREGIV
jgi:hypothetical protein